MANNEETKKEEFVISENAIYRITKDIKHKYSFLTINEIENLIQETGNVYNKFIKDNVNLKISITKFFIFYISKKIDMNLSEKDMMVVLKENINLLIGNSSKQPSFNKTKNNKNALNNYVSIICEKTFNLLNYTSKHQKIKRYIKKLATNYPKFTEEEIAIIIVNALNIKIIRNKKETNLAELCENYKIDFFEIIDVYINLYITNQDLAEETNILHAIGKIISPKKELVYMPNLADELNVNRYTFSDKYLHLSKKFSNVPTDILLKGTCDYYYIKNLNDKLLDLMPKIINSAVCSNYRDSLILEIVLLRMEQVLTYEEAYEMAIKNFEEGTSLLYSKYGDNDSNIESTDISFKK